MCAQLAGERTYWGIQCRSCRELVAFDVCPYLSFGPDAASMKPGAIRCTQNHNHIYYFPHDFRFIHSPMPIPDTVMQQNREVYRAVNPSWHRYSAPPATGKDV